MKRVAANGRMKRKSPKVQYCGDVAYVRFEDGDEWNIMDGTPPPPESEALLKELAKELKEEALMRKKELLAVQRNARPKSRKASSRKV